MALKLTTQTAVTIATAGTRVQVSSTATFVVSLLIQADALNTGKIYVGDSSVASTNGIELDPGQSLSLTAESLGVHGQEFLLSDVYLDTATNGNKARISYAKRR